MKEVNGRFIPPEDEDCQADPNMTAESVKKACLLARDARVKKFKEQDEKSNPEVS